MGKYIFYTCAVIALILIIENVVWQNQSSLMFIVFPVKPWTFTFLTIITWMLIGYWLTKMLEGDKMDDDY